MKIIDQNIILNNGVAMPQFGLGTCGITKDEEITVAMDAALKDGYRLFDTADVYANHKQLGSYLQRNNIDRKKIFITSKIWNKDHAYEASVKKITQFLDDLQTDYLDLLLIHWPTRKADECYKAICEAYEAKKVRAVGVSNFTVNQLKYFVEHFKIKPMVNQIELHPGLDRSEIVAYCQKEGIAVTSWQTIGRGKCLTVPLIVDLAKQYRVSPACICLKWAVQLGLAVIPKSIHPNWILENIQLNDFTLDKKTMNAIAALPQGTIAWDVPDVGIEEVPWKNN